MSVPLDDGFVPDPGEEIPPEAKAELAARGFTAAGREIVPLDTDQVRAAVQQELDIAVWGYESHLYEERRKAMEAYLGRPFGNEQPDRSQVVLTDVADTIEWVMPQLMRMFTGSNQVARFLPTPKGHPSPEQLEEIDTKAQQATDFINNRFYHHMDGFTVLFDMFKTALLEKNGVVKIVTETKTSPKYESYEELTEEQLQMIMSEGQVEVRSHEQKQVGVDPQTGQPIFTFDIDIVRIYEEKELKAVGVPPEQFFHEPRMRALDDNTYFCGDRVKTTVSELISLGYPPELVTRLPSTDTHEWDLNRTTRFSPEEDEISGQERNARIDEASREIWLNNIYIRIDEDGDGYSELRHIIAAGDSNVVILDDTPVNHMPYASVTPVPMPYKYNGRSMADLVMDLQFIRSTLLRQMLDNLYLTNSPRVAVDEDRVEMDDLLTASPGGAIRTDGPPGDVIMAMPVSPFPNMAFDMLGFLEDVRQTRTGITKTAPGLDGSMLNQTAGGVSRIMEAAQSRIEEIARIFAATGVKRMFWLMYRELAEKGFRDQIVRLRGEWVPIDPSTWHEDMDVTIQTGLGVGEAQGRIQGLQLIAQLQQQVSEAGLTPILLRPKTVYNTLAEITRAIGYENEEMFFVQPDAMAEFPPPPPSPDMMMAEAKQTEVQIEGMIAKQEADTKTAQQASLDQFRQAELASNERIAALNAAAKVQVAEISKQNGEDDGTDAD